MKEHFKIALVQMNCRPGRKKENLAKIERAATWTAKQGGDLLVLPELSLTGYVVRDEVYRLAEEIPGPSTAVVEKVAKKTGLYIAFGMPEKIQTTQATLHNTAVLVGPKGLVGKHRKMYLPTHSVFEEKRYFRPGYEVKTFETDIGKLGIIICYDLYFPEVTRLERLQGAQMIICLSASPAVRRSFFETLISARAIENTMFMAFVNLVGVDDGLQFWGGSRLVGPNGRVIVQAKYDEEDSVIAEVDYDDIRPIEAFVPTLKDLRPELFGKLEKYAEEL